MERIFFEGFTLQAGLIFALGAQNLFVLEAGLHKRHHLVVCLVCFLCDLALILLGTAGAASIFTSIPSLRFLIGIAGVFFLFVYGLQKMVEVAPAASSASTAKNIRHSILLAVTFSILNPHAYLDAFVLIGGYSSKYAALNDRIVLGLGAAAYSGVWFLVLSSLAGTVKPFLEDRSRMRMVGACAGVFLVLLSGKLAMDVLSWIPKEVSLAPWPDSADGLSLYSSILF